jgi:hypothetical protein
MSDNGPSNKVKGTAAIGSAAVVAALIFAGRQVARRRAEDKAKKKGEPAFPFNDAPETD